MTVESLTRPSGPKASFLRSRGKGRRRALTGVLGATPFLLYTGIFLLLPTLIVAVGAFIGANGSFSLDGVRRAIAPETLRIFGGSLLISVVSSLVGAVIGGLAAIAIATSPAGSLLRRIATALSSVLAQFAGLMLAFAFIATMGVNGMLTRLLQQGANITIDQTILPSMAGVTLVYSYFQIPLMVVIFLPAIDALRPQWREATANLGGSAVQYWLRVAAPILAPSFLASVLLLFANAFSAYATAAALISQQTTIVPMAIDSAIRNENDLGMDSYAQVLALGMVIVVSIVMALYSLLQRRTARWLR